MKTLGLLRHAKSDWDDVGQRDFDRGLNDRGRQGAELVGMHIRNSPISWDKLFASPAQRVRCTLESAAIGPAPIWDERLYLADTATIFEVIADHAGDADAVLIAGHNPGLQEMLFALVPPGEENAAFDEATTKFPTSSFAILELDIDDWSKLEKGCGRLVHFVRPRDLDPALGPAR